MQLVRSFLVSFANIIIVAGIILSTIGGFMAGGGTGAMYGYFSIRGALVGAVGSFLASCAAMAVLAILLDIRASLARLEQGGRL